MLTKRETPKSFENWQQPVEQEVIEAQPYDYSQMEDDMPSVDDWFRIRIWQDELNGVALTG
jgi:hypothetical protein